jgi:hypothetical protein
MEVFSDILRELRLAQAAPSLYKAWVSQRQGDVNAAQEHLGEAVPNLVTAGMDLPEGLRSVGPGVKGMIAPEATLNKPSPGEGISPRQIYEAAKAQGVHLDAAQATGVERLFRMPPNG